MNSTDSLRSKLENIQDTNNSITNSLCSLQIGLSQGYVLASRTVWPTLDRGRLKNRTEQNAVVLRVLRHASPLYQ